MKETKSSIKLKKILTKVINSNQSVELESINYSYCEATGLGQLWYSIPNSESCALLLSTFKGKYYFEGTSYSAMARKKIEIVKSWLEENKIDYIEGVIERDLVNESFFNEITEDQDFMKVVSKMTQNIDDFVNKPMFYKNETYCNMDGTIVITKKNKGIYEFWIAGGYQGMSHFLDQDLINRGWAVQLGFYDSKDKTIIKSGANHLTLGSYFWDELIKYNEVKKYGDNKLYERFNEQNNEDSYALEFVDNLQLIGAQTRGAITFINTRNVSGSECTRICDWEGKLLDARYFKGLDNRNGYNSATKCYEFYGDQGLIIQYFHA